MSKQAQRYKPDIIPCYNCGHESERDNMRGGGSMCFCSLACECDYAGISEAEHHQETKGSSYDIE